MLRILSAFTLILLAGKLSVLPAQSFHPVVLSLKIQGKERSISKSGTISLSSKENSFSFDYGVSGANIPAQMKYSYKLEGFDSGWVDAGKRQYINYTNMPGGDYTFKLKAGTDSTNWLEMHPPLFIYISTPFYKTGWFIAVIAFAIFLVAWLVIYFAYRAQMQRILMTQKIRNNIASDLHDDIGSSLSSIMLMSEIVKKQPEQSSAYFTQITETAGKIIENMNDIVWAVNPTNDNIAEVLMRMQNFASVLLEKKDISLQFNAENEIENLKLRMEERKNFYLIFKEAIHNAFKYAACDLVKVNIVANDKTISMKIEDNGKGFDTSKNYMGNGLNNMQKRTTEINGKLQLLSAPGNGTVVYLIFETTQTGS